MTPASSQPAAADSIQIVPVTGRAGRKAFIEVPWRVYAGDPNWVPPLRFERRLFLTPRFNPFFEHAEVALWVAYRDGEAVGRISAQIDRLHQERHGNDGFFGLLEAVDDPAVFERLLAAAEAWLKERGVDRVLGPFSLSINQESGVLVEGFDAPPRAMMGHARPYYGAYIERCGYTKVRDLIAYRLDAHFQTPEVMRSVVRRAAGERVRIRPLDRARFDEELQRMMAIFNDAWSDNWGFVPFTPAEIRQLGQDLKPLVPDRFIQFAEVDGEAAAMIVLLPDIHEWIRDLDGRLWPTGWWKLLRRVRAKRCRGSRVPLMGVRKRYQNTSLGVALVFLMVEALREPGLAAGIEEVEMSWILEENLPMRHIIERLGGTPYKTYRVYEKGTVPFLS